MTRATLTRVSTSRRGRTATGLVAALAALLFMPALAHAATTTSITVTDSSGAAVSGDRGASRVWPDADIVQSTCHL